MRQLAPFALSLCLAVACGTPSKDGANSDTSDNNTISETNSSTGGNNTAGDNNAALGFDPGVASDRTLDSLSEEELATACAASRAYYAESGVHAAGCLLEGYTWAELAESMDDSVLRQACSDRYETCLAERARITGLPQLCGPTSSCTGTVRMAVACAVDAGQGLVTGTELLPTCDALTFEDLGREQEIQLPPAPDCAALNATCN